MADFPALTPNARSLSLGNYPQEQYAGPSGVAVRFLYNQTKRIGQRLSLTFTALTEAQVNSVTDHYAGQEGSLIPFDLPSTIWTGYSSVPVSASDYQWKYANTFSVDTAEVPGRFNIEVTLESVLV